MFLKSLLTIRVQNLYLTRNPLKITPPKLLKKTKEACKNPLPPPPPPPPTTADNSILSKIDMGTQITWKKFVKAEKNL